MTEHEHKCFLAKERMTGILKNNVVRYKWWPEVAEVLAAALVVIEEAKPPLQHPTPGRAQKQTKPAWTPTNEQLELAEQLDPDNIWSVPNDQFPRVMSNTDVDAMLARKRATNPSPFWQDKDTVEGWLIGKGIRITA